MEIYAFNLLMLEPVINLSLVDCFINSVGLEFRKIVSLYETMCYGLSP